ncbi:MAG: hypothetical protein ACOC35_05260 [Promethearchaeia archaeon]
MRYKKKTFSGFVGGSGSLLYNFTKEQFLQSQGFIVNNDGENLIKRLLEEREFSSECISMYPLPTYNKYLKHHYINYNGYQWGIFYYDDTDTDPDYFGIKIFRKSSTASAWSLIDTINGYDEIYGAFLFNDRFLITGNKDGVGLKTIYSDDQFSSYSEEDGASFNMSDYDVVHSFNGKMYKFAYDDYKLYESTDGLSWTEKMSFEEEGKVVQMEDDGSFLYLLINDGKQKGRLFRIFSDFTFDVVTNFSNTPTDMIYLFSSLYVSFLYGESSFMIGEVVDDTFVKHTVYSPPLQEKDDLEIEDVRILFSDGERVFFVPRWEDKSFDTLYGDIDSKVKNRCIEFDSISDSVFYVHKLGQGINFLAGLKNRKVTSFLVEYNSDFDDDHDFFEYHDQNLKYQSSGEIETGDFHDEEMILKQVIVRHDPLPSNCSVKLYQKKDKESSWSDALIDNCTEGSIKTKYDYNPEETADYINWKIRLESADNLNTPKNIRLTLVYTKRGLENNAK